MIYVTVGSSIGGAGFERLIMKIDEIAPGLGKDILMQIGSSQYVPKNTRWLRYASYEESLDYFKNAELVIGHCGSGTIINALSFATKLILVPRRQAYLELPDEHQLEIARFVEKNGFATLVYDLDDLEKVTRVALASGGAERRGFVSPSKKELLKNLQDYVSYLSKRQ